MATIGKVPLTCVDTLHGGPPVVRTYPEAANQTFKAGEPVYLNGSGDVAAFVVGIDTGGALWLGFAAHDGQNNGTAGAVSTMVLLAFGNVFELNVTANGADQVTAKTQVGTLLPMYHDATNSRVAIDISNTSGTLDSLRIMALSPKDAAGDTNGRVLVTVIPAAVQVTGS